MIVEGLVVLVCAPWIAVLVLLPIFAWCLPHRSAISRIVRLRLYVIYPVALVVAFALFCFIVATAHGVTLNEAFFKAIDSIDRGADEVVNLIYAVGLLFLIFVMYKFKDRLLLAAGFPPGTTAVGEFRDWATCWSMRRFRPLELFVYKVAAAPGSARDEVFLELHSGYNAVARTRARRHGVVQQVSGAEVAATVVPGAGPMAAADPLLPHGSSVLVTPMKERVQLNVDLQDGAQATTIILKSQNIVGSTELARVTLSAAQLRRLLRRRGIVDAKQSMAMRGAPNNAAYATATHAMKEVWQDANFEPVPLIPHGTLYIAVALLTEDGDTEDVEAAMGLAE